MSVRTDVVNLNVNINGNKAQNDLNNLRKKAADVKLEMEGLKKGTEQYIAKKAELQKLTDEMGNLKKQIGLTSLTQKELIRELNSLKAMRGSVIPFSDEYKQLSKSIKEVESRLYDVRNGVQGFASFFSKIKDEVKQFGVAAAAYLGFEFISSQFKSIISGAGKLSDSLADIRRVTGLTAEETKNLNTQLTSLDTRTSTAGLREIAIIAGKLGVAKEELFGFTKEVDKLVVALGDELGDADQITTQLGKILNVFDGKVTADNISKLGNAFVELANAGVASGGFIADFTQRVSGIAKASGLTLGATVGLGAGLEELGQRSESSATAIQKLLNTIASDIPKAAKIAGVDVQKFANTFASAPQEALIQFAEGLTKNKSSFAEIAGSFKDAGEEGARVVDVLYALGQKGDFMREKIDLGNKSIKENAAINEAFALKNETFGATLDKLGKEFNKLVTSPGVTNFLKGAVEGAVAFIKAIKAIPFPITIAAFTSLTALILLYAAAKIKAFLSTAKHTVAELISNITLKAKAIATNLVISAQAAYITITNLLTGKITLATAAQRLWNTVMGLGKLAIGGIVTIGIALVGIIVNMASATSKLTAEQRIQAELQSKITSLTAEEETKAKILFNTIKQGNGSYDEKKKLLTQLINLNPEYLSGLTLENIKTKEGLDILNNYVTKLREANKAKAQNQLILDKEQELQKIQNEDITLSASDDKKGNFFKDIGAQIGIGGGSSGYKLEENRKKAEQLKKDLDILYTDIGTTIEKTVTQTNSGTNTVANATGKTIASIKDQIKQLDEAYEGIDITNKKSLKENRSSRDALQKELDSLDGKKAAKAAEKAAVSDSKHLKSERERLKKEAEQFYDELLKIKKQAQIKGEEPEDAEIQRVTEKYGALLKKAKDLFFEQAKVRIDGKKQLNQEEKLIEEAHQIELDNIFQKYHTKRLQDGEAENYEKRLLASEELNNDLKISVAKQYADGKMGKEEYEKALKNIERDGTDDRIKIAEEFANKMIGTVNGSTAAVKKAVLDEKKFKKDKEKETTQEAINESEKRKEIADREALSKAKRAIVTSRPGSDARLEANENYLKLQFEQETKFLDKKSELYLLKDAELKEALKELENQSTIEKIDNIMQYVGYFQDALTNLNKFINNRENAQFAREKSLNDKKKKLYKEQLDNKLLSKEQYDKKVNKLNEEEEAKQKALQRKQAQREKSLSLFSAVLSTAAAVAGALAAKPVGPWNIVQAAIFGALGALQIGAIASAPLPELGKGDWFTSGDKHSDPSGGIPVKIERDEAVMKASAMTDKTRYTVTGTGAQITSALNSKAGGVNWAGGAVISMAGSARINPSLPKIMEQGGIVRPIDGNQNNNGSIDNSIAIIAELKAMREDMKNWKNKLKGEWVIKDLDETRKLYETSKKASGFN